jgi:hypothetical protein
MLNHLRTFYHNEDGVVSVEAVLWMSGLFGLAVTIGNQIVVPLVANAQTQAALNQESLDLIQAAVATCGTAL